MTNRMSFAISGVFFAILCAIFLSLCQPSHAVNLEEIVDELEYLTERDAILSKNIANSDTPEYKSRDLIRNNDEDEFDCRLAVTSSGHLSDSLDSPYKMIEADSLETKANGNNVTLESEMAKKQEDSIKLQEMINTYKKLDVMLYESFANVAR